MQDKTVRLLVQPPDAYLEDNDATKMVSNQDGELGAFCWSDDGEASDGARGSYPERESVASFDYDRPSMRNWYGV